MIRIKSKFGRVDVRDEAAIHFAEGLLGFPHERDFVLLEKGNDGSVGYLQSCSTSWLALPVMDAKVLGPVYSGATPQGLVRDADLGDGNEVAMLIVLTQQGEEMNANLRAPVVVDLESRKGAQLLLDPTRYPAIQVTGNDQNDFTDAAS